MKIGIIGSMQFSERMLAVAEELRRLGHQPVVSLFVQTMVGKNDEEKERLKIAQKHDENAMKRDIEHLSDVDAILMLNLEKNGVPNYVGGNAFLELGVAYLQGKKLFFTNPLPDTPVFRTELEAFHPVILNGDLTKIRYV